ncbi:NAD(P)H-binding protein [Corynebacterium gerontici]|uniref:Putative sugar epimerase YhfK n=1 Tax=Corynebacterium gerontici TaxID=2079234 RepID=A0A3G6J2E0_9CORY|nr:NAD(P)H-binding protein [Corynebacterium gerontici]AZA11873.1 putative sugar epimerase YhfK [Corynebacterium gerontici]
MTQQHTVLIVGGHGKVALKLAPLLTERGMHVSSMIRSSEQAEDIQATGAEPVIADVRNLSAKDWDELLQGVDTLIWSAGAGGKGGTENTYAVDRDAAIASIGATERAGIRYIMVSFWGATTRAIPEDHPLHHYGLAKKAADEALLDSKLEFAILAPTALSEEDATGIALHSLEDSQAAPERDTSRELVARVAAFQAQSEHLPNAILPFCDGEDAIPEAFGIA